MKRDMELVRAILFALEEKENSNVTRGLKVDGYSGETVPYHCKMMHEAGMIDFYSESRTGNGSIYLYQVGNLTWYGQEYLEQIRQDTVWNRTKDVIKDKGLPMALDIIKEVSAAIIEPVVKGAVKGLAGQ